jgi:hypothetical protein
MTTLRERVASLRRGTSLGLLEPDGLSSVHGVAELGPVPSLESAPSGGQGWCPRGDRGVGGAVAEHGPEEVEAAPGQGKHGLDVGFAFNAFSIVVTREVKQLVSAESPER